MNEKKKLSIQALLCDLRYVSEEVLKQYESVNVKIMMSYVTEKSQVLLNLQSL